MRSLRDSSVKGIICICSEGYRGIREFSLYAQKKGYFVIIMLKMRLKRELLEMITPYDKIKIRAVGRALFNLFLAKYLISEINRGRLKMVVVTDHKTERRLFRIGQRYNFRVYRLIEEPFLNENRGLRAFRLLYQERDVPIESIHYPLSSIHQYAQV